MMELSTMMEKVIDFYPHAVCKHGSHVCPWFVTDGMEVLGMAETKADAWRAAYDQLRIKCEQLLD